MNLIRNFLKEKKLRNRIVAVLAVLVIGFLAVFFLSANKGNAQNAAEATVVALNAGETVEASGSLSAEPFARLEWKTDGVVESVNVKTGDMVETNDTLVALQPSSTSSSIVSAKADLVQAQKDLEDLLNSDADRAQAAIDLQDAKDAYKRAYDYRIELNGKIWQKKVVTRIIGGHEIADVHWYKAYPDPDTIADADRDLALKKSELDDAQRAYDRLKDGPNAQDVAAAQAKVDAAQATVNSLNIIAPFDGEVLSVEDHVGDVVSTSDLSVNLADMNHLYVNVQVDESDIAKVKVGNKITATMDAAPEVTLTGKVTAVNPVGEETSGLVKYEVRVDFDRLDGSTFLPLGATVDVVIQVKEASNALAVPITAIQNDSKGEYIMLIKEDGSTTRVDVVSGDIVGDLVIVTGNLKEGDRVSTQNSNGSQGAQGPFGG